MAIDHHRGDHIVTYPGEVVGATFPGQSETREGHNSTAEAEIARFASRRNFLRSLAGASALFLVGGGIAYAATSGEKPPAPSANMAAPTPEASPLYEAFETKDLTMNSMELPETLNPKTFPEVVANVGQAIEYAINSGDRELIRALIPGGLTGTEGTLQPGQFELRALFIKGFRESSQGTGNDHPDDPQNERYYSWGFKMELLDDVNPLSAPPSKLTGFNKRIRITMGDLPPLPTLTTNELNMEPPQTFEVEAEFTRYAISEGGEPRDLHNIIATTDGGWTTTDEPGWALASVDKMYPIPNHMAGGFAEFGFPEVPPLFKES